MSARDPARPVAVPVLTVLTLLLTLAGCGRGPASLAEVADFGANPGNLRMFLHVPPGAPPGAPVVLALPGCTQTAEEYRKAGWDALADAAGFHVVYAEQPRTNNPTRCFNWFQPGDQRRGEGEPASLVQMVEHVIGRYGADRRRVFVTGASAGGAMTAVLLAAYPDVFSAGSILAAGPYRCATGVPDSFRCLRGEVDLPAQAWGDLVRAAHPGFPGPYPRVSVWHGSGDTTVSPRNLTQLVRQWTDVHGLDQQPEVVRNTPDYAYAAHRDRGGAVVVESWLVDDLGHAIPVDPGPGPTQGGETGGYFADADVNSTAASARFFGLVG